MIDETGTLLEVHDMPVISSPMKSGKTLQRIDAKALDATLRKFSSISRIVIEQVGAMPGQGVTSTFNFGHGAGTIEAVARLHCDDVLLVRPAVWKAAYGLGADKNASSRLLQKSIAARLWR